MSKPIYTDEGTDYPELKQPPAHYVQLAEDEFDGEETTWPEVNKRAWELVAEDTDE